MVTKAKRGRKKGNAKGRTAPGPLAKTGSNHAEAKDEAKRIERRRLAWNLYVYQRMSMAAIAEHLTRNGMPCTNKTICQDIHAMADEAKQETAATQRHGLDMELKRLDQLDRQLMPLAMGEIAPDRITVTVGRGKKQRRTTVPVPVKSEPRTRLQLEAIEKLRRNGESRRKLLGIDKAPDEGYIPIDSMVALARGLVGDLLAIAGENAALRKQLADAMRRRFGAIEGEVVEQA